MPSHSDARSGDAAGATELLLAAGAGDRQALDRLFPLVYAELRRIASRRLRGERAAETLQTTSLVHEVYLRLVDTSRVRWQSRSHFFALAARAMRHILVDRARQRAAQKRGGAVAPLPLEAADGGPNPDPSRLKRAGPTLRGSGSTSCLLVRPRLGEG